MNDNYAGAKGGGFEAFASYGLNTGGGRKLKIGGKGFEYMKGPLKGKTQGEAMNFMHDAYAKMSDGAKKKYEDMGSGKSVRSSRERAAGNEGSTVTMGRSDGPRQTGKGKIGVAASQIGTLALKTPLATATPKATASAPVTAPATNPNPQFQGPKTSANPDPTAPANKEGALKGMTTGQVKAYEAQQAKNVPQFQGATPKQKNRPSVADLAASKKWGEQARLDQESRRHVAEGKAQHEANRRKYSKPVTKKGTSDTRSLAEGDRMRNRTPEQKALDNDNFKLKNLNKTRKGLTAQYGKEKADHMWKNSQGAADYKGIVGRRDTRVKQKQNVSDYVPMT